MPQRRRPLSEMSGNSRSAYKLTPDERSRIIGKDEAGVTHQELAKEFGVTTQCIRDTIKRWKVYHTTQDLPRSGRPHKLSVRDVRLLKRCARKTPKIEYKSLLQETGLASRISKATAYRRLNDDGLKKFRCKRRPRITSRTALKRVRWERTWRHFDWRRQTMRFSDECSVQVGSGASREWAFRYPHEKYTHEMVEEYDTGCQPSQMVWASIWLDERGRARRSPLVIMERDPTSPGHGYTAWSYCRALEKGLLRNYRAGDRFQQDNARIHTARTTVDFMQQHGIWVVPFPPYSPDLNPIEHMWYMLKKTVHQLHPEMATIGTSPEDWEQFCAALKEAWRRIPDSYIKKLIWSMGDRLAAVRRARGYQTKY
jgi:transposase